MCMQVRGGVKPDEEEPAFRHIVMKPAAALALGQTGPIPRDAPLAARYWAVGLHRSPTAHSARSPLVLIGNLIDN